MSVKSWEAQSEINLKGAKPMKLQIHVLAILILASIGRVATATSCPQNGKCPDDIAAPALAAAEFFVIFCQKADQDHAADYRLVQQQIAMEDDPRYLERLRKSAHYQEGLRLAESGILQMGHDKAFETCRDMLAERQQQSSGSKATPQSKGRRTAEGAQ